MKIEVQKYRKANGYVTRFWSVMVNGELLAVTLYRKGAVAVARAITNSNTDPYVTTVQDSAESVTMPRKPAAGVATYRTR